jgi:hypothetical protein
VNGPGFTFWGLFLACALIVVGYVLWMLRIEAIERAEMAELAEDSGHDHRRAVDAPPPPPGENRGDGS